MSEKLNYFFQLSWLAILASHRLILWNSFLAYIPLVLSFWLFRAAKRRSPLWYLTLLVFIAFLPNAPYVLTDTIHLKNFLNLINSPWVNTLVVLPIFTIYIFLGFEAYVISVINLGYYLQTRRNFSRNQLFYFELLLHALAAIGIYLGRFLRFNSWDFVTKPVVILNTIDDLFNKQPFIIILLTFIILSSLYWFMKQVTLAVIMRFQQLKQS